MTTTRLMKSITKQCVTRITRVEIWYNITINKLVVLARRQHWRIKTTLRFLFFNYYKSYTSCAYNDYIIQIVFSWCIQKWWERECERDLSEWRRSNGAQMTILNQLLWSDIFIFFHPLLAFYYFKNAIYIRNIISAVFME